MIENSHSDHTMDPVVDLFRTAGKETKLAIDRI
jgi:hypothetical protein